MVVWFLTSLRKTIDLLLNIELTTEEFLILLYVENLI